MQKKTLTIIIPVHNEEHSLLELHKHMVFALEKEYTVDYIYVDDASTDTSFDTLLRLKKHLSEGHITIIKFRKHLGKSAALSVGFARATGEYIVTIDADLQDDPTEIPKLIEKIKDGYHVVSGWRIQREDNWQKIMLSKFFNRFVRLTTGVKLHDFNTGLKAYTQQVVKEISLYGELHRYIPVLAAARGFKVTEVAVRHHKRAYGNSKYGISRVFQAGFDLWSTVFLISFKERPMQLFGMTGTIAIIVGLGFLTYLSYLHFLNQSIGRRPLLTLGVLLVLFGVQLVSTGLLAELFTNYNQSHKSYPIDKIIS